MFVWFTSYTINLNPEKKERLVLSNFLVKWFYRTIYFIFLNLRKGLFILYIELLETSLYDKLLWMNFLSKASVSQRRSCFKNVETVYGD